MSRFWRGVVAAGVVIAVGVPGTGARAGATVGSGISQRGARQASGGPAALADARLTALLRRLPPGVSPQRVRTALSQAGIGGTTAPGGAAAAMLAPGTGARAGGAMSGMSGSVRLLDGRPAAGACAVAAGPAGVKVAVTDQSGRFAMAGLPAGRYTVRYFGCAAPGRLLPQWYTGPARGWATAVGGAGLTGLTGLTGPAGQSAAAVVLRSGAAATLAAVTLRPAGLTAASTAAASSTAAGPGLATAPGAVMAAVRHGGRIAGVVTSKYGKPLAGICVLAAQRSSGGFAHAITNTSGTYLTPLLPPGNYLVLFSNCHNAGNYAPQFYKNAYLRGARTVSVTTGKVTGGISAHLLPGATISGVTSAAAPASVPLTGVCVFVYGTGQAAAFGGQAISGTGGKYRIENLATGSYAADVDPACQRSSAYLPRTLKGIQVTDGRTTAGVNAVLALGGSISGTVTAGWTSQPLAGACVVAFQYTAYGGGFALSAAGAARSASDGTYTVQGLVAGQYVVEFAGCGTSRDAVAQYYDNTDSVFSASHVAVTLGQLTSGIDATMQLGGTISGRITDTAGHPLARVCVAADSAAALDEFPLTASTGPDGRYTIAGIAPGQASVLFGCSYRSRYVGRFYASPADPRLPAILVVTSGAVMAGVNAALEYGGRISGVATDRAGKPLPGECVLPVSLTSTPQQIASGGELGVTGKAGGYTVGDLAPGRYHVRFFGCFGRAQGYAARWYKARPGQTVPSTVRVLGQHTVRGIDARLALGGTISGTVLSASTHQPLAGVYVTASEQSRFGGSSVTNRQGDFLMRGLSAGTYTLSYAPHGLVSPLVAARQVQVVLGKAAHAPDVSLRAGGAISGTLLSGSPASPFADACVFVFTAGQGLAGFAVTGNRGRYQVSGLAPGSYQGYFIPDCGAGAGLAPQWYSGARDRLHATAIMVKASQVTSGIGGTFGPDGALSGAVTDSGAQPLAGICATVYPVTPGPLFSPVPIVAFTAADGSYSVPDVRPGRYKVEFSSGCGATGYATQWYQNATSRAGASYVAVKSGLTTSGIDGKLVQG